MTGAFGAAKTSRARAFVTFRSERNEICPSIGRRGRKDLSDAVDQASAAKPIGAAMTPAAKPIGRQASADWEIYPNRP
jgi:hypothetical protein